MTDTFWAYEIDGEIYDAEYPTKEAAGKAADLAWEKMCYERCDRNGQEMTDTAKLCQCEYDEGGQVRVLSREDYPLEYVHYHGDKVEHGTYWGQP